MWVRFNYPFFIISYFASKGVVRACSVVEISDNKLSINEAAYLGWTIGSIPGSYLPKQ